MSDYMEKLKQFLHDEEGLTTVEYAIAGSLVGLAVATAFFDLGEAVGGAIETMTACIGSATSAACTPAP